MKKYFGVLGMLILAIVSALVVVMNYKGLNYTVSNHSASTLASSVIFCIGGTLATLLIAYNVLFCIPQVWKMGKYYKYFAGLFSCSFIMTCAYPNDPTTITLHDISAWFIMFSGFALLIFVTIKLWKQYDPAKKVISVALLAASLATAGIAVFDNEFLWRYILIFEPGMVAMFFILCLLLTFSTPIEVAKISTPRKSWRSLRSFQRTPPAHSSGKAIMGHHRTLNHGEHA